MRPGDLSSSPLTGLQGPRSPGKCSSCLYYFLSYLISLNKWPNLIIFIYCCVLLLILIFAVPPFSWLCLQASSCLRWMNLMVMRVKALLVGAVEVVTEATAPL